MMTRRGAAGVRASGAAGSGEAAATSCAGAGRSGAGATGADTAAGAGGCATGGALAATGPEGGAAAMAGRVSAAGGAPTGGLATTGPAGGLAAIAGLCGGAAVMGAAGRGCGTILRGTGFVATGAAGAGTTGIAGFGDGVAATAVGLTGAGAEGAGAARGGGADAAASCSFFCRMAFSTSPGFETWDRSILGLGAASPRAAPDAPDLPRWRWVRTRSASSYSSELECVFFSVTPTASRTSRMALLLTSSSRAKSLIRTLLIRPFLFAPLTFSCALRTPGSGLRLCFYYGPKPRGLRGLSRAVALRSSAFMRRSPVSCRFLPGARRFQRYRLRLPRFLPAFRLYPDGLEQPVRLHHRRCRGQIR